MNRILQPVAKIHTEFPEKFGIPRQSRLADTEGMIVFELPYRNMDAVRGLEDYSHIWLIWGFKEALDGGNWSPTVRPPRLGGNERRGVFATRSPFRPNGLGLSLVKLKDITYVEEKGPVLLVEGADMLDGTVIYDIKPYIPYLESVAEAKGGFTEKTKDYRLEVCFEDKVFAFFPKEKIHTLIQILSQDPRPGFHHDEKRVYGMKFSGYEIKFRVSGNILHIISVEEDV